MANLLKMAIVESIRSLFAQGWSRRRIARELGVDRETVRKYLSGGLDGGATATAPSGLDESKPATFSPRPAPRSKPARNLPTGSVAGFAAGEPADRLGSSAGQTAELAGRPPEAATPEVPRTGPTSDCEPYRELIEAQATQGLTARRIHQDLVSEQGAAVGYDSLRRFLRRLGRTRTLPFRRMEVAPGEEAQVDFGTGAPLITSDGKRRKTHVFRIVLSHSRKGYSEATLRQTTEDFLGALENALAHFGGVPQTLVIDNLKAAVAHPDWFDPVLTPKIQSFCQHYGTVILPTKPRMPRHKGKVERGVGYVQDNGLKGRKFASLAEQNQHLLAWETGVADTRIHGTTKRHVGKMFREVERSQLLPLPSERFPSFHEAKRKVHRDGHVEVAKSYYSVPPEYLTREVWARWDARLVRIFNQRFEQIALHVRHEPGRFSTLGEHLAAEKIHGLERGAAYLLHKVSAIGSRTQAWAEAMLVARGIQGTRVLQGLLALTRKHRSEALEKACEIALSHGAFRLQTIRKLVGREADKQPPLPFLDEHPLIRPLDDYAQVVARAFQRQQDRPSVGESFLRHGLSRRQAAERRCPWPSPPPATPQQTDPGNGQGRCQGVADTLPPRSGYPSSGCSSAAPDSVSPDDASLLPPSSFEQEPHDE